MPCDSSFQPESNGLRQFILLEDAQMPQETKDKLSSLLEKDYSSNVSKSPLDVGRTNLFQMDIPKSSVHIAHKCYPHPLKDKKFMDREIRLLENAACISKAHVPPR